MEPGAAQDVALVEHRLANKRVSELEPLRDRRGPQQPGAQDLVERCLGGLRLESRGGLQSASVVFQAEDCGGGDHLVRVLAHARQANAHGVPNALRHHVRSGLRQLPQHLLDEERVAIRARVHTRRELVAAQHRAGEFGHVVQRQAAQVDPVERAVAASARSAPLSAAYAGRVRCP